MKIVIDQQFQDFLEYNQLDLGNLLEKSNIPNLLWKEELTLGDDEFHRFQEILSSELTDDQLILLSDVQKIGLFMPVFFVALSSSNGLQAIQRLAKYKKLIAPVNIKITTSDDEVLISIGGTTPNKQLSRFSLFNEQLVILSILRAGSGQTIVPKRIEAPYPSSQSLSEVFGAPVKFVEAGNILVFNYEDMEKPFLTRNNSMRTLIEPEMNRQLEELKTSSSFINNLHQEIQKAVPSGDYSIDKISRRLGTSTRTLQRNLRNSKTTFKAETQVVQKKMALHFSHDFNLSVEEIAYMVGYSEVSSFARAFKKWTGTTLSQYRKRYS
ncbi:AraC family transcriptional regulator [Lactococcus kimchii]|uniref:AraC family transcriptional regulator n=1 Tax=Lactococcus sp. S-13 TaxID=2507158 RepID=UPI001023E56E|nr:AraC family transcriptional regulator [Lactococcus sp. S-13]RZI49520.1 AraC family transcriptional regulator [Lactococcus sp. S-13]